MDITISERQTTSEKNGTISVRRGVRGGLHVYVNGYQQSGAHLAELWRRSMWHVPESHPVKQVLLLGLGGGSCVRDVHARFPDAHGTVVEWDPAMGESA